MAQVSEERARLQDVATLPDPTREPHWTSVRGHLRLRDLRLDGLHETVRIGRRLREEAGHQLAVAPDEVFVEVPLRRIDPAELLARPLVERMRLVARHNDLVGQRK